jgi:antitoxin MazE
LTMANIINRWGNSLGVRIPLPVANEIGLKVGSVVDVTVVDGKAVISPVGKKYTLGELLEGVTPDVIDGEYDWGKPVGNEAW